MTKSTTTTESPIRTTEPAAAGAPHAGPPDAKPPDAEVTLRPARACDEDFLRSVFADDHDQLALLGPDVRDLVLDMEYRGHLSAQRAAHPRLERFVIEVGGSDVGVLACDRSGLATEVLELVVTRACEDTGVATFAVRRVSR